MLLCPKAAPRAEVATSVGPLGIQNTWVIRPKRRGLIETARLDEEMEATMSTIRIVR
jgi:hypothetical protein